MFYDRMVGGSIPVSQIPFIQPVIECLKNELELHISKVAKVNFNEDFNCLGMRFVVTSSPISEISVHCVQNTGTSFQFPAGYEVMLLVVFHAANCLSNNFDY